MAELTINTGDITAALQKNLSGYNPSLESTQVGRVLEVGDGIARVSGLPDVGVNELLEFEGGTVGRVTEVGDGIARVSGLPDCAVNELLEFEGRASTRFVSCTKNHRGGRQSSK